MQNLYICVGPLYFPCPFLQETPGEPIIDFSLVLTVFTRVKNQGSTCQQPKSKDGLGKDGLSNLKIRKTPNLLPVFTHPSLLARPNPKVKTVCKDGHFTSYLPVFTLPVFTCWNEFRGLVDSHGPIELPWLWDSGSRSWHVPQKALLLGRTKGLFIRPRPCTRDYLTEVPRRAPDEAWLEANQ